MARRTVVPKALRGWVIPLILLVMWWAAVRFGWSRSPLLVAPGQVWRSGVEQVLGGKVFAALGASLWRDLGGFAIGASAAGKTTRLSICQRLNRRTRPTSMKRVGTLSMPLQVFRAIGTSAALAIRMIFSASSMPTSSISSGSQPSTGTWAKALNSG